MLRHRFFYVNMNKKSLNWGMGITVVWLAIIFIFWFFGDLKSPISLNELGDFLAGIFAPVAFLWLVLGYVQQGKQLEQNIKALEQQEQALQLQIDEMKESIKQQKNVVLLLNREREEAKSKVRPKIQISNGLCQLVENEILQFNINIENTGVGEALEIIVKCDSVQKNLSKLTIDRTQVIQIEVPIKEEFNWYFKTLEYNLEFEYRDILGNSYYLEKLIIIENNNNQLRQFKLKFI